MVKLHILPITILFSKKIFTSASHLHMLRIAQYFASSIAVQQGHRLKNSHILPKDSANHQLKL